MDEVFYIAGDICPTALEDSVKALSKANPLFACLASNPIADSGKDGFGRMTSALERVRVPFCGAGSNPDEMAKSFAFSMAGENAVAPKWLSLFARGLQKLHFCKPRLATGARSAGFLNMLQCEAHNEALRTYLREHLDG